MADISVAKEIVENHTTEEVIAYVSRGLKEALRNYEGSEDFPQAAGVLFANVSQCSAYLDALQKKLAPKEPVVA